MLDWASLRRKQENRQVDVVSPEPPAVDPVPAPNPRNGIALALGGGAARGWAHIGVLRALEEAKIPIGMIAGTSIGALVGGCYLAGKLDELEEFARSLTKRRIFGLLDINFGGSGLFGGMKLTARMEEHLRGVTFDDLSKPFVCVAAEIRTGHMGHLAIGGPDPEIDRRLAEIDRFELGVNVCDVDQADIAKSIKLQKIILRQRLLGGQFGPIAKTRGAVKG